MELGSQRELDSPFASGFSSCISDTVFETLLCAAVETAIMEVYKLPLRADGV